MLRSKKFWTLLILSTLLLVLPGGLYSAFDKDEPKYLEAAWEMVKGGDYITPYYNYEFRFDKPILVYWLIAAGYKLFGVNEFGGRFFVSLCGVLTVLLLFWWLRRLKGENFAFWTSLIFLSLLNFIVMASV
ncbi:MAG: glycosyltransferase family 39 protein, partial [Desulfurobacteriaceae bacterium]